MENIIQKAIIKALALHAGQVRKGDGTPYIAHPLEVGYIVSKFSNSETFIAAAILHDTIEDCDYTKDELTEEFGEEIATLVMAVTQDPTIGTWVERKVESLIRAEETKHAMFIKAADGLANMRALTAAVRTEGQIVWSKFNAPKELKLHYYRDILRRSIDILPVTMVAEYVEALKDLEYADTQAKSALGFPLKPAVA